MLLYSVVNKMCVCVLMLLVSQLVPLDCRLLLVLDAASSADPNVNASPYTVSTYVSYLSLLKVSRGSIPKCTMTHERIDKEAFNTCSYCFCHTVQCQRNCNLQQQAVP